MSDTAISDSAAAFIAGHAGPARARQRLDAAPGSRDASIGSAMAELGWFAIAVPQAAGGLDLGAHALCLVAEQAGRGLLMPPLTMAMAAARFLASRDATAALGAVLAGRQHVALARGLRFIPDGDLADAFVCSSGEGEAFEARLIGKQAARLERCVDGSWLATIATAAWADAARVSHGSEGEAAWIEAQQLLRLGDAAYLCGLAASALALSLDYLRLRQQFGVAIGSFQALQHRAADCHIQLSAARALVYESARAFGSPRADFAAAASIRRASAVALQVTQETVQFHGAIGFADEHDAGLYLRRAMVVSARHSTSALQTLQTSTSVQR